MQARKQRELADLLVQCRTDRGLSMEDVAQDTGLSIMTIARAELRTHALRRTTYRKLSAFLRKYRYYVREAA